MKFTELELHENLQKSIKDVGFVETTQVQELTFNAVLNNKDVCVQSKTGTGKTAAFLISIFQLFEKDPRFTEKKALIVAPTRELAIQIDEEAQVLGKYCGFKTGCFYGGVGYGVQEKSLHDGINLYIGTPGRLIDFYKSKKIDFRQMEIVVIDEADRMFDMGFIQDIRYILKKGRLPKERLTLLFSATLGVRVKRLAWELMNDPVEIEIESENITVDKVTQGIYHVGKRQKFNLLLGIMKSENPKSAIIFSNTKHGAEMISNRLKANGIEAEFISGDLPQKKRLSIIENIKEGKVPFLVATDVAARGLHVDDLEMVINYDLPQDASNYIHRIGRTARAGKEGKAFSLADEETVFFLEPIQSLIGMKIPEIEFNEELLVKDETPEELLKTQRRRPERRTGSKTEGRSDAPRSRNDSRKSPSSASGQHSRKTEIQAQTANSIQPKPVEKKKIIIDKNQPETGRKQPVKAPVKTDLSEQKPVQRRAYSSQIEDSDFTGQRVSRLLPLNERIKIYEKKYGKDFVYKRPKGIIGKILSIFRKK